VKFTIIFIYLKKIGALFIVDQFKPNAEMKDLDELNEIKIIQLLMSLPTI